MKKENKKETKNPVNEFLKTLGFDETIFKKKNKKPDLKKSGFSVKH